MSVSSLNGGGGYRSPLNFADVIRINGTRPVDVNAATVPFRPMMNTTAMPAPASDGIRQFFKELGDFLARYAGGQDQAATQAGAAQNAATPAPGTSSPYAPATGAAQGAVGPCGEPAASCSCGTSGNVSLGGQSNASVSQFAGQADSMLHGIKEGLAGLEQLLHSAKGGATTDAATAYPAANAATAYPATSGAGHSHAAAAPASGGAAPAGHSHGAAATAPGGMAGMPGMAGHSMAPAKLTAADFTKMGYIKTAGTMTKYGKAGHNGQEHIMGMFPERMIPGSQMNAAVLKNGNAYTIDSSITALDVIAKIGFDKTKRQNPKLAVGSPEFQNKMATTLTGLNNYGNIKNEPGLDKNLAAFGLTRKDMQDTTLEHLYHSTMTPQAIDATGVQDANGNFAADFKIKGSSFHQYDKNNWSVKDLGNGMYEFAALSNNNNAKNSHNNHELAKVQFRAASADDARRIAGTIPGRIDAKTGDGDDRLNPAVARMFGMTPVAEAKDAGLTTQQYAASKKAPAMPGMTMPSSMPGMTMPGTSNASVTPDYASANDGATQSAVARAIQQFVMFASFFSQLFGRRQAGVA